MKPLFPQSVNVTRAHDGRLTLQTESLPGRHTHTRMYSRIRFVPHLRGSYRKIWFSENWPTECLLEIRTIPLGQILSANIINKQQTQTHLPDWLLYWILHFYSYRSSRLASVVSNVYFKCIVSHTACQSSFRSLF